MHSKMAGPSSVSASFKNAIYKVASFLPECDADAIAPVCVRIFAENRVMNEPDARRMFSTVPSQRDCDILELCDGVTDIFVRAVFKIVLDKMFLKPLEEVLAEFNSVDRRNPMRQRLLMGTFVFEDNITVCATASSSSTVRPTSWSLGSALGAATDLFLVLPSTQGCRSKHCELRFLLSLRCPMALQPMLCAELVTI